METITESPTKSAPPETQEAATLLAQGKRHLIVKDTHEAVSCLSKACELFAAHYGERAVECGDAYLCYGRALLELARCETGVLGDALGDENAEDTSEDDDEEDTVTNGKDEEKDKSSEEGDTESGSEKKDDEAESEKKDDEPENAKKEESGEAKTGETETQATAPSSSTSQAVEGTSSEEPTKKEEDEEDDTSNLKLAWEMLELAKLIFQGQQDSKPSALKLADVYLMLGEISLESETYDQAVEDMRTCMEIQLKHLQPDDRRIAETHFQLGTAYSLCNQWNEALEQYSKSMELIELRIKNLEAKLAAGDKPDESDAFYTVEGEIKELTELLPEIKERVSEITDVRVQALAAMAKMMEDGASSLDKEGTSPKAPEAGVAKPVSNISHLVRKKRKADEGEAAPATTEGGKGTKGPDGEQPAKMRKAE